MAERRLHLSRLSVEIAQLRHAYSHLAAESVTQQREFADGLIAPAISFLESIEGDWRRCSGCGKTKPVSDFTASPSKGFQPGSRCGLCRAARLRNLRRGEQHKGPTPLTDEQRREELRLAVKVYISARVSIVDRGHSSPCWIWKQNCNPKGYGLTGNKYFGTRSVHRISYITHNGDIPEGLTIDHLCRVRNCCNPAHLEAVTLSENQRRKPRGRRA